MKKITIALACVIGMMFFASCDPDALNQIMEQLPEVEFVSDTNYVSGSTSSWVGDEVHFQIRVEPNGSSQSPIASVHFAIHSSLDGSAVKTYDPEITNPNGENFFDVKFVTNKAGIYEVTVEVKDQAGKINLAELTIDYVERIESVIGTYQGNIEVAGRVKSDKPILGTNIDEDYTTGMVRTEIVLGQLTGDRAVATFEIDGRPISLYCTKDGNNLVFDEFNFHRLITLVCPVYLNITVNATAVLDEEGKMTLTGTANGTGAAIGAQFLSISVTLTGNINGDLNEVPAE